MWVFLLLEDCYPFRAKGIEIGLQSACFFNVHTVSLLSSPCHITFNNWIQVWFWDFSPRVQPIIYLYFCGRPKRCHILIVVLYIWFCLGDSQYFSISPSWNNALMQELQKTNGFHLTWPESTICCRHFYSTSSIKCGTLIQCKRVFKSFKQSLTDLHMNVFRMNHHQIYKVSDKLMRCHKPLFRWCTATRSKKGTMFSGGSKYEPTKSVSLTAFLWQNSSFI